MSLSAWPLVDAYACVYEIVKHGLYFHIAVADLFDSPGFSPSQSSANAAAQSSIFRGIDSAALLESLRHELSSSHFDSLYGYDPAADPAWLDQTGYQSDLAAVAEERSDDEGCGGAFAGAVDESEGCSRQRGGVAAAAGRAYSCDHCHCSVCKRSLEQHECQRSVSSSSEHEVMTDDAGGTAVFSSSSVLFPWSVHHCVYFSIILANFSCEPGTATFPLFSMFFFAIVFSLLSCH